LNNKAQIFDLRQANNQPIKIFGHDNWVNFVVFDPTGNLLATGCDDKKARIFDIRKNDQPINIFDHDDVVDSISFDPTGNLFATGCYDDTARVFANAYHQLGIERGKEDTASLAQVVALYKLNNKQ